MADNSDFPWWLPLWVIWGLIWTNKWKCLSVLVVIVALIWWIL